MRIDEFDYELPEELIAQKPADRRDASRLLVVDRKTDKIRDGHFYDILDYLKAGDCLVLNDSRVIPARLFGRKIAEDDSESMGARVEFLLIKRLDGMDEWEVMVRPGKRVREGHVIAFAGDRSEHPEKGLFRGHVTGTGDDGTKTIRFEYEGIFMKRLEELGSMPLPPYIQRPLSDEDKKRYQTVYSREEGSVAAPTAGLHFTEKLLKKAKDKGVDIAYVTLHVGIGTFRPVKSEKVEDHHMHYEEYSISSEAAAIINRAKDEGRRIICVGTTSARTIESAARPHKDVNGNIGYRVKSGQKSTGIFIYPGYEFKMTDALITNFHLPKSTLIMLISAFYDREKVLEIYRRAVRDGYRFFSYGDAMLIL